MLFRSTDAEEIANFGTIGGTWLEDEELLHITEFAEKPPLEYAEQRLQIRGISPDRYLTIFGQYIIAPQIFDYLDEAIENNVRERGEFQLTSALDRLRQEGGFLGLMIDGQRFDLGLPEHYLETLQTFHMV